MKDIIELIIEIGAYVVMGILVLIVGCMMLAGIIFGELELHGMVNNANLADYMMTSGLAYKLSIMMFLLLPAFVLFITGTKTAAIAASFFTSILFFLVGEYWYFVIVFVAGIALVFIELQARNRKIENS
jgi:hypothetical protein